MLTILGTILIWCVLGVELWQWQRLGPPWKRKPKGDVVNVHPKDLFELEKGEGLLLVYERGVSGIVYEQPNRVFLRLEVDGQQLDVRAHLIGSSSARDREFEAWALRYNDTREIDQLIQDSGGKT